MTENYSKLNLHQKIIEVMKNVRQLSKDTSVAGQYKALSEFKVTSTIAPELIRFGLTILPIEVVDTLTETVTENNGKSTINRMTSLNVKYQITNADNPSESMIVASVGQGIGTGDKVAGIASTYSYKVLQLRVFGVGVGGDEDIVTTEDTRDEKYYEKLDQEKKILLKAHFADVPQYDAWILKTYGVDFDKKDRENLEQLVTDLRKIKKEGK